MILCGDGQKLSPFNADRSSGTFKPLLPVANRPMVLYTLDWARRANFAKVTIAVPDTYKNEMELALDNEKKNLDVRVHEYTAKYSAEIVADIVAGSTSDFVVLPCDLFTDLDPVAVVNNHRNRYRSDALVSAIYYTNTVETIDKKALVSDCVAHTPFAKGKNDTLLLDSVTRAHVKAKKSLTVHNAMLIKHPYTVVSTNLLCSGIYLCSRQLGEFLSQERQKPAPMYHNKHWNEFVRDLARRSWRHRTALEPVVLDTVPTDPKTLLIRCNNLSAYVEANRLIMRQRARNAGRQENKAISADSLVGNQTTIGDKSTVKRTVVGNNCVIGPKCRLVGCVIMDNAVVNGDVHLENCIIGKGAVIRPKCRLTSCHVEGAYEVRPSTQAKNEVLQSLSLNDDEFSEGEMLSGESSDESEGSDGSGHFSMSEGEELSDDDGLFER